MPAMGVGCSKEEIEFARTVPRPGTQGLRRRGALGGRIGAERRLDLRRCLPPRTSQTSTTPRTAEPIPTMRNGPSGRFQHVRHRVLRAAGLAAKISPSITNTRPSATRKSDMRGQPVERRGWSRGGRFTDVLASSISCASSTRLAGRVGEIAEEVAIRLEHHAACRSPASPPRRPASSGRRRKSPDPCRTPRQRSGCVRRRPRRAICSALDVASAINTVTSRSARALISCARCVALGAEFGGLALALGLHALIDRLAVLLRQIGAADTHVDDR